MYKISLKPRSQTDHWGAYSGLFPPETDVAIGEGGVVVCPHRREISPGEGSFCDHQFLYKLPMDRVKAAIGELSPAERVTLGSDIRFLWGEVAARCRLEAQLQQDRRERDRDVESKPTQD